MMFNYLFLIQFLYSLVGYPANSPENYPMEEINDCNFCGQVKHARNGSYNNMLLVCDEATWKNLQTGTCENKEELNFKEYIYVAAYSYASGCSATMEGVATWDKTKNEISISIGVHEEGACQPLRFLRKCYRIKRPNATCTYWDSSKTYRF